MWGYEGAMQEEEEEGGAQAAVCKALSTRLGRRADWWGRQGEDKPDQARHHSNNSSSKTAQM